MSRGTCPPGFRGSSLPALSPPGTLVGWRGGQQLILSQTMGRDCGPPRGAHCSLGPSPILGSTLWMEVIFLPEASRRRGCRGKWYCRAGLPPGIPEAPGARGPSWTGPQCGSSSVLPTSILRTTEEPAEGGGEGVSVCL